MSKTTSEITSNAIRENTSDPTADGAFMVIVADMNIPFGAGIFEFSIRDCESGVEFEGV
jgi:hypothetical protein